MICELKSLGIIITSFNNSETIVKSTTSAIALKAKTPRIKIRILVVDDASSDQSIQLVNEMDQKLEVERVHVFEKNGGVSRSRNFGIDYFHDADYITFLDADDELTDSLFHNKLYADPCTDLILFDYFDSFNENNRALITSLSSTKYLTSKNLSDYLKGYAIQPNRKRLFNSCWGKIFNVKILKTNPKVRFNNKLHIYEDLDFVLRFLRKCKTVYYVKEPAYVYNIPTLYGPATNSTFGFNWSSYQLFSFFYSLRQLYFLLIELKVNSNDARRLLHHCYGVYFCISIIRSFVRVRTPLEFFRLYLILRRIFNKRTVGKAFLAYSYQEADGNAALTFFLKKRLFFIASIISYFEGRIRYRRQQGL